MMDTLTNPRAVIGNNEPPLNERLALDHVDLVKKATEAAALVPDEVRAIENEEEAAAYTQTASDIMDVIDLADDAFEIEKKPWREGGKTVDDFFAFRKTLAAAAKRAADAIKVYQNAQLAAKRKAEAEAAEKARKEAIAFDEAPPVFVPVAPKEAVRVSTGSGAKASGTLKWKPRLVDFEQVPRQYLVLNERALQAAIDGMKAQGKKLEDAKIPGVEIYEDIQTSIRR
jgi:hypothetical protein